MNWRQRIADSSRRRRQTFSRFSKCRKKSEFKGRNWKRKSSLHNARNRQSLTWKMIKFIKVTLKNQASIEQNKTALEQRTVKNVPSGSLFCSWGEIPRTIYDCIHRRRKYWLHHYGRSLNASNSIHCLINESIFNKFNYLMHQLLN